MTTRQVLRSLGSIAPLRTFLSLILIATISLGCTYIPTTSLRYTPVEISNSPRSPKSLVVLPLKDMRGVRRYPSLQGNLFKTYIPLLPYVKIPYERLDESHIVHQRNLGSTVDPAEQHFTSAFAREIARDLRDSQMFREVRFAASTGDAGSADLVLSGALRSTEFDIYASSYMLGIAGVLLWLAPIPLGRNKATVALDLELRDADGSQVWSHTTSMSASKLFTLYNSSGEGTSSRYRISIKRYGSNDLGIDGDSLWAYHAEALRGALGDAKASLAEHLAQEQLVEETESSKGATNTGEVLD